MAVIITLIVGGQVLLIGYLIRNKMVFDHNNGRFSPELQQEAMAKTKWVGNNLIYIGALSFLVAFLSYLLPAICYILFFIYTLAILPAGGLRIYLHLRK
ncbi:MAG: hypothetical protein WAO23_03825 [Dethiobacteria bacterium]